MMNHAANGMHRTGQVAALDIGTTKITCLIGRVEADGSVRVVGAGHQLSQGLRSGSITDVQAVRTSIIAAVNAAETMAGHTLEEVLVNLPGNHLKSRIITVDMTVEGQGVSESDVADILHEGYTAASVQGQSVIHAIPVHYMLDGQRAIKDPRGMYGRHLSADLHVISAPEMLLRNLSHCLAQCHLNVAGFIASPYATALASLEEDEKELGVTLVDIGGGVSSVAVFNEGRLIFTDSIPLGGSHVTSDIAKGLSTSLGHAERIKTVHGSAIPSPSDEQSMIEVPQLGEQEDEASFTPRSMLVGIVRPRMEEILEMIRGRIEASGLERLAGRRVVLTGGGAQLIGVRELAGKILGKQVRLAQVRPLPGMEASLQVAPFATAIGMLHFAAAQQEQLFVYKTRGNMLPFGGGMQKIINWFRENF
jgi:cell division protein FtsA